MDAENPIVLTVTGRVSRAVVPDLCARLERALTAPGGAAPAPGAVADCDVGGVVRPDLALVDAVARLAVVARRSGHTLRLRRVPPDLRALLDLVGLADVVGLAEEPGGVGRARGGHGTGAGPALTPGEACSDPGGGAGLPDPAGPSPGPPLNPPAPAPGAGDAQAPAPGGVGVALLRAYASAGSRSGSPNSGNQRGTSRKQCIPVIAPSRTSMTWTAHGTNPEPSSAGL